MGVAFISMTYANAEECYYDYSIDKEGNDVIEGWGYSGTDVKKIN